MIGGFILILVIFINFVSAEMLISDAGVNYYPNLVNAFNDRDYTNELISQKDFIGLKIIDNQTWARIGVVLKDNSGIEIIGSKEEKTELVNQRIEWFKEQTEKFLEEFNDSRYIINLRKNSGGFSGLVSEEGLEFLLDKPEIDYINWEQYKPRLTGEDFKKDYLLLLTLSLIILILLVIFLIFKKKNIRKRKLH